MNMKHKPSIVAIVIARLDSKRLPNKALRLVNELPLIHYVLMRAQCIPGIDNIVVATSKRPTDDQLAAYVVSQDIDVYRGSFENVALRVLNCAIKLKADYFVRLNGDSPFLDPALISQGISYCRNGKIDFVTNLINRTFPHGISVEIIRTDAFKRAYTRMTQPEEHEHITQYLYSHLEEFNYKIITSSRPELNSARLVIDSDDDFELFRNSVDQLGELVFSAGYIQIAEIYLKKQRSY